jgi:3-hydroxybutyryl-CoA dehydrogenase
MVAAGMLGRKSGRGFYTYEEPDSPVVVPDEKTPSADATPQLRHDIRTVGVVGTGTMATGIVEVFAKAGFDVVFVARSQDKVGKVDAALRHSLEKAVQRGKLDEAGRDAALARVTGTEVLDDLADCDVVIEAAFEELGVKQELLSALDDALDPDSVIASNTSALSVTEIAAGSARPERVVGMHFFNPAPLMKLVEIVRAERTSDEVYEAAYGLAERLGKVPVRCHDTPGFVVNRILIPLLNDCVRVLDEARVTPEDVDRAMRFGTNWPIGPCALIDLIGVDVHVHASEALWEALREPRMAPPPRLVRMAQAGLLGRKTGRGFFAYE